VSTTWRARIAPVAAVVLGVIALGLGAVSVVLDSLVHQSPTGGPAADAFITTAGVVPATAVGTLLAARRPRNPTGWLLLAIIIVESGPASQYLILDYRMHDGTLPLGWLAVVLVECWPIFLVSVTLLLWLFPDGTLPSGRWHRAAVVATACWVLLALVTVSRGVLVAVGGDVRIQASGALANPSPAAFRVLSGVMIVGNLVAWVAWVAIQIPTYRHSSGVHRQQLKWLYSGAVIFVAAYAGVFIISLAVETIPGSGNQSVVNALALLGTGALPVCLGVAVLKYRLYELDRVISRVVSYALITALLGGVFAGLILLATRVLPVRGSVAVAVATLVVAALFNPLRKRVQHAVDRRFNRERYDAEAVVAAFTARMRRTIDLDTVRDDLVGAVHEVFQPAHASLWLPDPAPPDPVPALTLPGSDQP